MKGAWRGILLGIFSVAAIAAPALPAESPGIHLGVRTCANSNCHNAKQPSPFSYIGQNEFAIWNSKDRHAQSFKALQTPAAAAIARRLGESDPTHMQSCLSCHADNVGPGLRGKNFAIADGVACESCHGGAEHWLATHSVTTTTHAQNVAAGMYPTEEPVARARLCLSCHLGTPKNPMTHRLLGAGHPRLALELDSFTLARPAHHVEDDDYRQRKPGQFSLRTWALGQVVATMQWRRLHAELETAKMWPEFSFYECFGCHQKKNRETSTGRVFQPRVDTSSLLMTQIILERVSPELAASWKAALQALRKVTTQQEQQLSLAKFDALTTAALAAINGYAFKKDDALPLMRILEQHADAGELDRFDTAEQATYAAAVAVAVVAAHPENPKATAAMEDLYQAIDDSDRFVAANWVARFKKLTAAVR